MYRWGKMLKCMSAAAHSLRKGVVIETLPPDPYTTAIFVREQITQ